MSAALGLHLLQSLDLVSTPRPSALARLDDTGRLTGLDLASSDDEIVALAGDDTATVLAVDAPLEVPNATGRRDVETVLSWCDIAAFPVSGARLQTVHGGARGVALAARLARPGRRLVEALPDQVLRQIAWERGRPADAPALDLAVYRAAWLGVRAPVYRPKGVGRARPDGTLAAWRLLSEVVDLGGWAPSPPAGDWDAIADAARIDAICAAYAALRVAQGRAAEVGAAGEGTVVLAADANLAARIAATVDRLRAEGSITI